MYASMHVYNFYCCQMSHDLVGSKAACIVAVVSMGITDNLPPASGLSMLAWMLLALFTPTATQTLIFNMDKTGAPP